MLRFPSFRKIRASHKTQPSKYDSIPERLKSEEFGQEISKHRKQSQLYFLIGLCVALVSVQTAFRWEGPSNHMFLEASAEPAEVHTVETTPRTRIERPKIQAPPPPEQAKAMVINFGEVKVSEDYLFETEGKATLPDPDAEIWNFGEEEGEVDEILPDPVFTAVEVDPQFPGGMRAFNAYLKSRIDYTEMARTLGIQGELGATFVVEKDGSLSDIVVEGNMGYDLKKQLMKALKQSPQWKPGYQSGIPVRVQFLKKVTFVLN